MKELSPLEKQHIEQLRLYADWIENPFPREVLEKGTWRDETDSKTWYASLIYRRKVLPTYIPWAAEDVEQFRGIWVKGKGTSGYEFKIVAINLHDGRLGQSGNIYTFQYLFDNFIKLNGTPCGKPSTK